MKVNQILSITALAFLILSAWTYRDSVTRAERFERGQKFLPNLNPDEIVEIEVTKGEDKAHLRRQGEEFVVVSADGYPASNESVNRFLRDVLDIALEKEVGSGESLEEELELAPAGENTIEVSFKDANENQMVHFLVGKDAGDAGGNYVVRTNAEDRKIYLTSSRPYLRTSDDDFLKKDIVDVKGEDIVSITGADFQITSEDGAFKLADLPQGQKESSKVNSAKYILSSLRFDKQYLADAPEVRGLPFTTLVNVELNDDSGYQVELAEAGSGDDKKHYLRIQGFHKAQQLSIAVDAGDEEVKQTAETLERLDELDKFNRFHGSWIYEVAEGTANKIKLRRSELMESA